MFKVTTRCSILLERLDMTKTNDKDLDAVHSMWTGFLKARPTRKRARRQDTDSEYVPSTTASSSGSEGDTLKTKCNMHVVFFSVMLLCYTTIHGLRFAVTRPFRHFNYRK